MTVARKKPLALLIDEAYRWNAKSRPDHLGVFQEVIDRHPLLVVVAGTPDMMGIIGQGATFMNRAPKLCPGLLAPEAAAEALRVPLEQGGIAIDSDALRYAVDKSQKYPFFIQLWGKALWDYSATHGVQRLTEAHARAAEAVVDGVRIDYYEGRFEEIRKRKRLFLAATAVADAFKAGGEFSKGAVADMISAALADEVADEDLRWEAAESLFEELTGLGLIWRPADSRFVQAGIPSLMNYVAEYQ